MSILYSTSQNTKYHYSTTYSNHFKKKSPTVTKPKPQMILTENDAMSSSIIYDPNNASHYSKTHPYVQDAEITNTTKEYIRSALSYRGIDISQIKKIKYIGYNLSPDRIAMTSTSEPYVLLLTTGVQTCIVPMMIAIKDDKAKKLVLSHISGVTTDIKEIENKLNALEQRYEGVIIKSEGGIGNNPTSEALSSHIEGLSERHENMNLINEMCANRPNQNKTVVGCMLDEHFRPIFI